MNPEALMILTAAKTQLEAGVLILERARDNIRSLTTGWDPGVTETSNAIHDAKKALANVNARIKQLHKIQKGAKQ